jgi:hypothetical protein
MSHLLGNSVNEAQGSLVTRITSCDHVAAQQSGIESN